MTNEQTKLPAMQFYCGDWIRDSVSGCSLASQGLWLRLMLLMHDSPVYGELRLPNGNPMPKEFAARRCGCTEAEFTEAFGELEAVGVPSIGDDGLIYSRRMMRDAIKRTADRKRKADWRSRQKSNECHDDVPPYVPTTSPPSSSSSSTSTSTSTSTSASTCVDNPPTIDEVKFKGSMIGCKPEVSEKFFNQYNAQGWVLGNGQPMRNWQSKLCQWRDDERQTATRAQNGAVTSVSDSRSKYALAQKKSALKEQIQELEGRHSYEASTGREWQNKEKRKEWAEKRRELKGVVAELAR
jgi:hypothetical protein